MILIFQDSRRRVFILFILLILLKADFFLNSIFFMIKFKFNFFRIVCEDSAETHWKNPDPHSL